MKKRRWFEQEIIVRISPRLFIVMILIGAIFTFAQPYVDSRLTGNVDRDNDTATPEEITSNPQHFENRFITMTAQVKQPESKHAFSTEKNIVIIGINPTFGSPDGDYLFNSRELVEISGIGRVFDIAEIEKEFEVNLEEQNLSRFEGNFAIIAFSVRKV